MVEYMSFHLEPLFVLDEDHAILDILSDREPAANQDVVD